MNAKWRRGGCGWIQIENFLHLSISSYAIQNFESQRFIWTTFMAFNGSRKSANDKRRATADCVRRAVNLWFLVDNNHPSFCFQQRRKHYALSVCYWNLKDVYLSQNSYSSREGNERSQWPQVNALIQAATMYEIIFNSIRNLSFFGTTTSGQSQNGAWFIKKEREWAFLEKRLLSAHSRGETLSHS